ncbi:conserved hypothetical protein [Sphingobium sp. SYK-6]|uniref:class II aldolase/adducin family protein n=1 Tax=Sphingobium sp. (strain NBRC 103272 / SYK-6) TaxID=627192 RepID=UPI0002277554|nr:class II aldolase/adducin family protein [Sphingobium sp. SYK-6]BAK66104.1 conserved hypothetical protein [Sphingobium sp. SYK-6]
MTTGNIMASVKLVADHISPAEQEARVELAIAYRLFHWLGITDLIHTHISIRVPGEDEHFLQLPYGHLFHEARASDMVKCDVDGNVISDPTGLGISRGGFCIHSAIHMGQPRAACVMHAHTEATIAVANYREGLLPLSQHALRFFGKIFYLDYCGPFDSAEKRARLPAALADGDVLMLRNHGPLVIGKSVRECFSRIYYLERACRMQVATLSQCRDPKADLVWPTEEDCRFMARAFENGDAVIDREWVALTRMLDDAGADYAH